MERLSFAALPRVVQVAVGLAILEAWVLVGEFVIDRHGLDAYLPLYRVGNVCVWDVAVLCATVAGLWVIARRGRD